MADDGRCAGTTKDNRPCAAKPLPGKRHCPWHDPETARNRKAWSAQGGKGRSADARAKRAVPPDPLTAPELAGHLSGAFLNVLDGAMEPKVAGALASLAKSINDINTLTALEQRIVELEQRAGTGRRIG